MCSSKDGHEMFHEMISSTAGVMFYMKPRQTKHQGSFYKILERLTPQEREALLAMKHAPGREPQGIKTRGGAIKDLPTTLGSVSEDR